MTDEPQPIPWSEAENASAKELARLAEQVRELAEQVRGLWRANIELRCWAEVRIDELAADMRYFDRTISQMQTEIDRRDSRP